MGLAAINLGTLRFTAIFTGSNLESSEDLWISKFIYSQSYLEYLEIQKISYHVIDMISFQSILFLHILLASTSICLFLFRAIRALFFPKKNQFIQLKRLTIGIDSLLTITGITQIIYLNYQPLNQYWFWLKMGALIIYILAGILALRNHQAFYRRIGFLSIALSAVVIIILMATKKPY